MGLVAWVLVGAIAGYLAGFVMPGDERLGVIGHIVLGIVGAVVGGLIAGLVTGTDYMSGLDLTTIVVAFIGAVVVLGIWGLIANRRGTTPGIR